ncbi:unnamed protein product [Mytilus edulis]|uniref:G domain-containing protein n=1 Tax=Mytilus edulis TaxID=6550 RepID=A0A8S3V9G0_MYTED|nr:unnamed protein product [Mytilus edulis]
MEYDLSSAEESDDVVPDKTKDTNWKRKLELIKDIRETVGTVKSSNQVLNIAVIGTKGCGKSSFINTVLTSFRKDKWQMYSTVGMNSGTMSSITQHFRSFSAKKDYYKEEHEVLFPTFIDINGLEDENVDFNRAFLRALFNGKIEEEEELTKVLDIYDNNPDNFKKKMLKRSEHLKIDRIIVVTTADPEVPLPVELLKCIREMTNDFKGIPIFGVMTKKDQFERNEKRIKNFLGNLGITEDSFKLIVNYCPDADQKMKYHRTVYPKIDVPVLEIVDQVIRYDRGPLQADWSGFLERNIPILITLFCYPMQIAICLFILLGFLSMYGYIKSGYSTSGNILFITVCVIINIVLSLFLFVLPSIVKKIVRKGVNKWLLVILMVILLSFAGYLCRDVIRH